MKIYKITIKNSKINERFNWVNEQGQVVCSAVPLYVSEEEKEIWERNHPGQIEVLEVRED